ncbi:MAG: hypothetical protein PVI75_00090 [Gammaproteobacteria bacterium]|jgi:hypothetical protein
MGKKKQYPELPKPKYILIKGKNDNKPKKYPLHELPKILGSDFIAWKETIIIDSTYINSIPLIDNKKANQQLESFYNKMQTVKELYFYLDESDIGFSTCTNRKFKPNEEICILYSGELKPEKKLNKKECNYALTIIDIKQLYGQVIKKLSKNNKNLLEMTIGELGKFAQQIKNKNQIACSGLAYRNFGVYAPHLPRKENLTKEEYFCHKWLQKNIVTANLETVFLPHYDRTVPVLKKIKGTKIEKGTPLGHDYGIQVSELPSFIYHGRFFMKTKKNGYILIHQQPFRKTVDYYFSNEELKKYKQEYNTIWTNMKGKSKLEVIKIILNSKNPSGIDITQLFKLLAFTHKEALQSLTNEVKIKIYQYANYYQKKFLTSLCDKNMKEFLHKNKVPTIYTELCISHQSTNSIKTLFNQKQHLIDKIVIKLADITNNYNNKWKVLKIKNKTIIKFHAKLPNKKYEEIKSLLITKGLPKNSIDKKALKKYPEFYILYIDPAKAQSLLDKEIIETKSHKHTFS